MKKNIDKPLYPQPIIQKSVANVIASVTFGKRMDYEDPIFIKYMKIFNRSLQVIGNSGVVNTFPFVRYILALVILLNNNHTHTNTHTRTHIYIHTYIHTRTNNCQVDGRIIPTCVMLLHDLYVIYLYLNSTIDFFPGICFTSNNYNVTLII